MPTKKGQDWVQTAVNLFTIREDESKKHPGLELISVDIKEHSSLTLLGLITYNAKDDTFNI